MTDLQPFTAWLARSIATAAHEQPSNEQYAAVRRILIDWLGVGLAGVAEPVSQIVRAEFGSDMGPVSLLGGGRASAADAALINGTAGHALDYDDVQACIGHPGATIVPAALAVAEERGASGVQLARAIIAGYDAARFVGTLAMPGHYEKGFHSTATIGAFGAAAAAAVLMGLDENQISHAIGLAATQAAGLKSMFGTMAKPFHAGRAASAGVVAAKLAARGMTAHRESLETMQGFLATQAHQPVPTNWRPPEYGESLEHILFKYHAACYLTHSSIEAVGRLATGHGVMPGDVESIVLHVPAGHLKVCNIEDPATGLESKFSLRHVVALKLGGHDTADIAIFNDALAQDDAIRLLRRKVRVCGDLEGGLGARVKMTLGDGRVLAYYHDASVADEESDDLDNRLDAKFCALVAPLTGLTRARAILDCTRSIADLRLADLWADLRG